MTSPASFEAVFGKPQEKPAELLRLEGLRDRSRARLATLEGMAQPRGALYRTMHQQKVTKERKHLRDIEEAIRLQTSLTVSDNGNN